MFDRVEVRALGREVEQTRASRFDRVPHAGHLVGRQVVEDHRVATLEHWDQRVGDVSPEALAVGRSVEQGGGDETAGAKGGGDGDCLVMPMRHRAAAALTALRASVGPHHVGGGRGLIDEDEAVRIEIELAVEPNVSGGPHILALLLGGVKSPFFAGDAVATEEPPQPARARSDTLLGQGVAQFSEEDLRMRAADLQDRLGMGLDGGWRAITARGLGRDLTRVPEAFVPADRPGFPDPEAHGRLPA